MRPAVVKNPLDAGALANLGGTARKPQYDLDITGAPPIMSQSVLGTDCHDSNRTQRRSGRTTMSTTKELEKLRGYEVGEYAYHYITTGDPAGLKAVTKTRSAIYNVGWILESILSDPKTMSDTDSRILDVLVATGLVETVGKWMWPHIEKEAEGEDLHVLMRRALADRKVPESAIIETTLTCMRDLSREGKPNSAGRYLLSLDDKQIKQTVSAMRDDYRVSDLFAVLIEFAPERTPLVIQDVLDPKHRSPFLFRALLKQGNKEYVRLIEDAFHKESAAPDKFWMGCVLTEFNKRKHLDDTLAVARALLGAPSSIGSHTDAAAWLVDMFGIDGLKEVTAYLAKPGDARAKHNVLEAVVEKLGPKAIDAVRAAATNSDPEIGVEGMTVLAGMNDEGREDQAVETGLRLGLRQTDAKHLVRFLGLAHRWKPSTLQDLLWPLLEHKSKPVRDTTVRVLGGIGDTVVSRAVPLLEHRKADCRLAAVQLLAGLNTPEASQHVEQRLAVETDEDVRDAMLMAIESANGGKGYPLTPEELAGRMDRVKSKLGKPVVAWLSEKALPPLRTTDGRPLSPEAVRYLLYRQSRVKEMRADIEAKGLYERLDRKSGADFALAVLHAFLASKQDADDRWALALAGLLGDDRVVPLLATVIREWAELARGKLSEYAVQALALLGTDTALCTVDAMAIRYRSKFKNIGKAAVEAFAEAAEARGLTPDELGDRVVPWLGFEPGKPRLIHADKGDIEVTIGMDFKFQFRDSGKNKKLASLPSSVPAGIRTEIKELAANLKEVVKGQLLRLENLMVRQYRWPAQRWSELFLQHPLLFPFAHRLVWAAYDKSGSPMGTFRALEDRTLADVKDAPLTLAGGSVVGIAHPLELEPSVRQAWLTHLSDYNIETPFPQMARPLVLPKPDQRTTKFHTALVGTSINGMTFKGRAEKRGWTRGSVCDAGGITAYVKTFPAANVDVFLILDGMYVGIDMYTDITLDRAFFVRHGSVKTGSYVYDEPADEKDPRLVAFGDVLAIAFSEAMSDLQKIAGQTQEANDNV